MQDFNQEENLANWMDDLPASSVLPDHNEDFGGAEVGNHISPWLPLYNWPIYQSNHFENFPNLQQGVQNQHSVPFNNGSCIRSDQSHPHNIRHDDSNESGSSPANQACLPPQVGFPVQPIVNNNPYIPWNTTTDSPLWLDDTLPFFSISNESNAIHDVPDFVIQDLVDPDYPSLTTQTSSLASFKFPGGPANIVMPIPQQIPQAQAVHADPAPIRGAIRCSVPWCPMTFKRKHEQTRHEASVHSINQGVHRCPVIGCSSYGRGYSRRDKLTEHMWKKHANLGYTKRVL